MILTVRIETDERITDRENALAIVKDRLAPFAEVLDD